MRYIGILSALALLTSVFFALSCAPSSPPTPLLLADDLLGGWSAIEGSDATEIDFSIGDDGKGYFNSFLRGRPYESGTFTLKDGTLDIFANGNNHYYFKNIALNGEVLSYEENGKKVRLKMGESAKNWKEAKKLALRIKDAFPLGFSAPKAEAGGYAIAAAVPVSGDYTDVNKKANNIGSWLEGQGFVTDPMQITEIMTGYKKGKVTCSTVLIDSPDGNTCTIKVRCGTLNE